MMDAFVASILPGLAGMPNLHPMVVHFPIALLTSFLIFEILSLILKSESLRTGATWMLYAGTLGAIVTVIAGFKAASAVGHDEVVHAIMETHEHLGLVVLLLAITLSLWRIVLKKKLVGRWWLAYLALSIIMVAVLSFGSDYGGLMVYTHGVGVKAAQKPEGGHEHNANGHEEGTKSVTEKSEEAAETKTHHDSTPHEH